MKKFFLIIAVFVTTLQAHAQFEVGKAYLGASLSGLNLKYNGANDFQFGLNGQAGLFMADDLLVYGQLGYDHTGSPNFNDFRLGAGGRYYIEQNGIFLGANVNYCHSTGHYNDVKPAIEIGYAFFVSRDITIEPAIYYEQSFKNHSQYSTVGLKIGLGIYMHKDKVKKTFEF